VFKATSLYFGYDNNSTLGLKQEGNFFSISCTAEKETRPSSGTLWYQYKDFEK